MTGENLGGGQLTPQVMRRIGECDALVALMTRRDEQPGRNGQPPSWSTHPWVEDELKYARGQKRDAIALIETGVTPTGAYQEHEFVPYDRQAPLSALIKLSATIGIWKAEAGQTIAVQILPAEVADALSNEGDKADCQYRLVVRQRPTGPWVPTSVYPEVGGTFIYVAGISPETMVQVKAVIGGVVYQSRQIIPWLPVTLQRGGGRP